MNFIKTFRHRYSNVLIERYFDSSFFHSFFFFVNCKNIRYCVFCGRTICFIRSRNVGESDSNERTIDIDCSAVSALISRQNDRKKRKKRVYNGINERNIIKLHRKPFTRIQLRRTKCVKKNDRSKQR